MEAGFRAPIAVAIGTEVGAVILLATLLAVASSSWMGRLFVGWGVRD